LRNFFAERQLFAEGGFVNLDNANAVLFEVKDFVADSKAYIAALLRHCK
jgi:hypothetical protein